MLTLAPETIDQLRASGFDDLLVAHYEEVEDPHSPMAVNWPAYYGLERQGVLQVFALRRDGRLIGYSSWFVQPPLHHRGTLWAVCDAVYVDPDERRGWAGVKLIRGAEQMLREQGAKVVSYNVKPDLDGKRGRDSVGHLLRRLGYRLAEECWAIYL